MSDHENEKTFSSMYLNDVYPVASSPVEGGPDEYEEHENVEGECSRCRSMMSTPFGLESTKYCNLCAQDLVAEYESAVALDPPPAKAPLSYAVREQLWMTHGCNLSALYGDDGEMQCSGFMPFIDFKRDNEEEIMLKIATHNQKRRAIAPLLPPSKEERAAPIAYKCLSCKMTLTEEEMNNWVGCDVCEGDSLVVVESSEPLPPKEAAGVELPPRPKRYSTTAGVLRHQVEGRTNTWSETVEDSDGDEVDATEFVAYADAIEHQLSESQAHSRFLEGKLAFCGEILGKICVYGTLVSGEKPIDPPPHAAIDAILTQIERAEKAEAELTSLRERIGGLRKSLIAAGRAGGAWLMDEVSDNFLSHVAEQIEARIQRAESQLTSLREKVKAL